MAPFHPLRHEARVLVARAFASVAVFLAIALVLLGGSGDGPLASAEANRGAEPVLGAQGATPAGETPPAETPPVETPPAESPPVEEPPVETPPVEEPPVEEPPAEEPPAEEPPAEEPPVEEPPAEEPPQGGAPPVGGPPTGAPPQDAPPGDEPPVGGGDKEDPAEPEVPEAPPTPNTPEQPGKPGGVGTPGPTGGRPGTDPVDPGPTGGQPLAPTLPGTSEPPAQPGTGDAPSLPPVSGPPAEQSLGSESGAGAPGPGRLTAESIASGTIGIGGGIPAGETGTGGVLGAEATPAIPPAAAVTPGAADDAPGAAGDSDGNTGSGGAEGPANEQLEGFAPAVFGDLPQLLEFVPDSVKVALAGLAALSILLGLGYVLAALRNRRLERQRSELLQEVGLLQTALLPPVPERVGSLQTSVAYRPADGPGAGGDFYDVLPLAGGRVGFILGDVSGHGRGALARTAFMRYTLRAYLEAGLEPRVALQVAGRVIDENLGGDFATVLLAVHDPETGSLTYASAGHPAPLVVGPEPHEPVTAGSSPPIGVGVRTGLRQTTVPLVPGSVACLFTDGLMEARVEGGILGRSRLQELLGELGTGATASGLIESVKAEARVLSDDIAAVVIQPTSGATAGLFRTEQLELTSRELEGPMAEKFLESCGLPQADVKSAVHDARTLAERFGGVILHVVFGNRLRVEVLPRNVESIEAASRRAAAR